jgi:glycosyltransferase involved in cell wall biosynthesis
MRSVVLTKFVPLPANSGGRQRSLATLLRLRDRGDVVLCAFDDGSCDVDGLRRLGVDVRAVPWRRDLRSAARSMVITGSTATARFAHRDLRRAVSSAVRDGPTDVLYVNYLQLSPHARALSARRRVLDMHNVESSLMRSYSSSADPARRVATRIESIALRRLERRALTEYDHVVVVSDVDRARLPAAHHDVVVCPNGWEPTGPLPAAEGPTASFVALLGWRPNADAAEWLARDIWPHVRRAVPDAELLLVGRDPSPTLQRLAGEGITVTGTVPSVQPHLRASRIGLAPLRAGGGSRLKILEALGAGRPVVATSIGAEGLGDLVGHGVVVRDDPLEMAATIAELLIDADEACRLGALGRAAVEERYAWDATLAPLFERLDALR